MKKKTEETKKLDKISNEISVAEKNNTEEPRKSKNKSTPSPYLMTYFSSHIGDLL